MKTRALRLYGKYDLRLETFELPPLADDQILARVVSDSLCMSSYKAAAQGIDHKRVPKDIAENPIILGHEFCGELLQVGSKWAHQFQPGQKFTIQPALNYKGSLAAPGYSYQYIGGDATYIIIPNEVMEMGCLLPYEGDSFFAGSLAEPLSCVAGAFHASYHCKRGTYQHHMGIREGGNMAILAGTGPMGLAAIDYIIHCDRRPSLLVVTGRTQANLDRAAQILPVAEAAANGITLVYLNTSGIDAATALSDLANGKGYDDVLVFTPSADMVEMADKLLGEDGCLNFFAGPSDPSFTSRLNFYNVHYAGTHVVGTSGGNTDDMMEVISMIGRHLVNPAILVTHIGGLDAAAETTLQLPKLPGGKKLIYTGIDMPLTAIQDFGKLGEQDPLFAQLHQICQDHNGLWCTEAEQVLLSAKAL